MCINDTIIAQATPPGLGGISILRISGPQVIKIAKIILGKIPYPRYAEYLPFYDNKNKILDYGIALYFQSPNSFTGEDVLELQGHGGPIIINLLLKSILTINGIRIANPGEFSKRAFINNKIDLIQAEAITDLINASTEQAARFAINSLEGMFSQQIHKLVESIINLRIYIESIIDFSDENNTYLSNNEIEIKLTNIINHLNDIRLKAYQGNLLQEGMRIVLIGPPNAGKSSLFNALSGKETAIVTNIAGTTRDILREHIYIDGIPLHIIDTAGLCEATNEVEKIGIERSYQEIKQADHILFIIDSTVTKAIKPEDIWPNFMSFLSKSVPITVIRNKIDITNDKVRIIKNNNYSLIYLSTHNKQDINLLRTYLKESIGFNYHIKDGFLARYRHINALDIAAKHLKESYKKITLFNSIELLAEELQLTQKVLNQITGNFNSNDLLNRIFSTFCIGK